MDEGKKEEAPHKREKRKRIDYSEKLAGAEKTHDELEFKSSLGSKNARQIKTLQILSAWSYGTINTISL